jgi:hypothetical protein
MKKLSILCLLFLLICNAAFSQENAYKTRNRFEIEKNQHSFDIEFNYFGYAYAHKFSDRLILGFSMHTGFGLQFFLNTPKYLEYSGICYEGDCPKYWRPTEYYETRKSFFTPTIQILKFQLFYRKFLKPNFYLDIGAYYSLGNLPTHREDQEWIPSNSNIGINLSAFYGFERVKFGHRIQFGNIHIDYGHGMKTDITSLLLTLLVLQFGFNK